MTLSTVNSLYACYMRVRRELDVLEMRDHLQAKQVSRNLLKGVLFELVIKQLLAGLQHQVIVMRRVVDAVAHFRKVVLDQLRDERRLRLHRIRAIRDQLCGDVLEELESRVEQLRVTMSEQFTLNGIAEHTSSSRSMT